MTKNENVKKTIEACTQPKRHSEDEVRRISYFLKRFFANYKFPFAGNGIRPAQNDGENEKDLFTYSLINLFTSKKSGLLRFARNDVIIHFIKKGIGAG